MFAWLAKLFRRQPRREDLHVVLYTRAGCHLCDLAWDLLQTAQVRYGFHLAAVDVDADAALAAQHGRHVPVVAINDKVRFRGKINPALLLRLLEKRP